MERHRRSVMNIAKVTWLCWFPWLLYCHGKATEDPRSACDSAPCQNGAQCIDVTYPGGPLAFKCACKEGYEGLTCQKRIDLCADDPCQNGGVCSQRGEHYHCACPEGFHGKNCESAAAKKDPCSEKPCGPHGVCEVVNSQVSCECLQGYSGPKCETSETKEKVIAVPTNQNEEEEWVIRDILIAMLFFVVLFAAILFFVCCHCYRVWNQRSALKAVQEAQKAAGREPSPVIGWVDLSNQMCYDFFCCCFPRPEKSPLLGDRCFADPDNITGVIVPLKDYNTWVRSGYMPVGFGNGAGKVKIDNMVPEVDRVAMRGQPTEIQYHCEPVKYITAREEVPSVKMPASYTYERPAPVMQTVPQNQDVMEPAPAQTCDMSDMYSDTQRNMTHQQVQTGMGRMSESMTPETNGMQRQSYYSNMNINKEPMYGNYRKPSMPQRSTSNAFSADSRKISRSNLYAQYGKNFTQSNLWSQPNMMDASHDASHTFSQSTNQNHVQPDPNLDTYPAAIYNGMPPEPARPEFYSNGLYPIPPAPPYPWIPQPFAYPYAFPYAPQNNNQDNSSSEVCTTQIAPRKKVQARKTLDRSMSPHSAVQQKMSHGGIKGHVLSRRQYVGNVKCGESKMDHLQFTDDDAGESEATLVDISEDDGRCRYVDTDTDDELLDRVDDDGYGSTNRLSESEAGGRMRPSQGHHDYSGETGRHYIPRKHRQRIQKMNKLSPRSPQQYSSKLRRSKINERSPESYKTPLCNSEPADRSNYHGFEDSTSEDDKEDYLAFNGPAAVQNIGNRTRHDTYRVQQQIPDGGHAPHKLMRRGDLWSGQMSKCLTSQKCLPKGEDVHILKPVPKCERPCLTIAPKKVKGILKNNSHGGNYNRSASSFNSRKIKDVTVGRLNSRRRSLKHIDNDETE